MGLVLLRNAFKNKNFKSEKHNINYVELENLIGWNITETRIGSYKKNFVHAKEIRYVSLKTRAWTIT